jgi:hypothetical protein
MCELASRDDLLRAADHIANHEQGAQRVAGHVGSADRVVSQLHLKLGEHGAARALADRALAWCIEQRAIVEQARCEQLLADIELAEGNREAALPLLDSAAAIYDRFGLGLYLQQVIEKKEILKA